VAIAYLGPAGTFTETAARLVTGGDADLVACADIQDVLRRVEAGEVERGVVPIENTLEGSVHATLDALAFETDLLIEAELELPVTLVLAGNTDVGFDDVKVVYSHPVALAACRRWLSSNLGAAERVQTASTARAAQQVAAGDDPGEVAIVNPLAAERYGLQVLARGIADSSANSTRFVVIGRTLSAPTGWDKTSTVVFIDENRPGALLQLLEIFAERDLNLTKIESRPTKDELGEYCFFLDCEGHIVDERVGDALAAVRRTHRAVKILGSYRRSGARKTDEADRIASDDAAYRDAAEWLRQWRGRVEPA